jgi:hypothetical protein
MKTIRIILLILIIIGIGLLATERIWVPKLVDYIISSEVQPIVIPTPTPQANITLADGRQCYTYNHQATATEPYTVNEFIDINIKGSTVSGTKTGTQKGPDMTNGYSGTINGTLDKETITDVFSYVIEGSPNKEKEIYKAGLTGIEKLRYPLIESGKMLVPDTTKEYKMMLYARVGCTASN